MEDRLEKQPRGEVLSVCLVFFVTVSVVACGAVALEESAQMMSFLAPLQESTAVWAGRLAQALGMEVTSEGTGLRHVAGFAFAVNYRCTGMVETLVLAVGLLGLPGPLGSKLRWVILGAMAMLGLNLLRLVSLLYVGALNPAAFDLAHDLVWGVVMVVAIMVGWFLWLARNNSSATVASNRKPVGQVRVQ